MITPEFWNGKRVLLTGHTGFKGAWMALWLESMGAKVTGVGLEPDGALNLFSMLEPWKTLRSVIADVRDAEAVTQAVADADPEIVIHMAAQALVRRSYREPVETMETNVMGTVHVLEALRKLDNLQVALVITSDKVYRNTEDGEAFSEEAPLGGDDPYSASKASQEILTQSWAKSFFADRGTVLATARAGNVIGGGDFSEDRLIPDIYRAIAAGETLVLRSPQATRPWQHVLDLNAGYLMYIERLAAHPENTPRSINFGPAPGPAHSVGQISDMIMQALGNTTPTEVKPAELKEKTLLSVDATLARNVLGWEAQLDVDAATRLTANWYGAFLNGSDPKSLTIAQMEEYGVSLKGDL